MLKRCQVLWQKLHNLQPIFCEDWSGFPQDHPDADSKTKPHKKNFKKTTLNQDYILLPKFSKHSVFLVFISEVFDWEESGVLLISTWELKLSSLNILSFPQFPFLSRNLVVKKIWECRKSSREYKIICAGKT